MNEGRTPALRYPTAPLVAVPAAALLLDLDGTLVDSRAAVEAAWRWAAGELGVPFAQVEPYVHGIPAAQALVLAVPNLDDDRIAPLAAGIVERIAADEAPLSLLPGVAHLLANLPGDRWAVVTSGDIRMALASIRKAGVRHPPVLVTSDDVAVGKPAPDPFLVAARALGVPAGACVVVEDSPAGGQAGRAAGARVVAVGTTSPRQVLAEADWWLPDLRGLLVTPSQDGLVLDAGG